MVFTNVKEMISYTEGGIFSKEIFKDENKSATLFCMAKGTQISDHTSAKEGFVSVIEGEGTFVLEGKEIKMVRGVLIKLNRNVVHSLNVEKDTSFILFLGN